jgi:hypothetical protein
MARSTSMPHAVKKISPREVPRRKSRRMAQEDGALALS